MYFHSSLLFCVFFFFFFFVKYYQSCLLYFCTTVTCILFMLLRLGLDLFLDKWRIISAYLLLLCGYSDYFSETLTIRSMTQMTPRWPLTPLLLMSHVWLYPRIIVSNSHKNTSKHVDTVTLFSKTLTRGQWTPDIFWPQFCWGHMCDPTQGSL